MGEKNQSVLSCVCVCVYILYNLFFCVFLLFVSHDSYVCLFCFICVCSFFFVCSMLRFCVFFRLFLCLLLFFFLSTFCFVFLIWIKFISVGFFLHICGIGGSYAARCKMLASMDASRLYGRTGQIGQAAKYIS